LNHDEYYEGLDWKELVYGDRCRLIFMIEAASYCEENGVEEVQRARVKERCDRMLSKITNGQISVIGGTLERIIKNRPFNSFDVTGVKNKNKNKNKCTFIRPDIPLIQKIVARFKTGNNEVRFKKNKRDTMQRWPDTIVEEVRVSDGVAIAVNGVIKTKR
jgi:hypothetical protein